MEAGNILTPTRTTGAYNVKSLDKDSPPTIAGETAMISQAIRRDRNDIRYSMDNL